MTATAHQTAGISSPTSPASSTPAPEAGRSDAPAIVVGTRGSALALWQTRYVLDRLRARHPQLAPAIEEITTRGDRTQALHIPLTQLGDKSMFVAELERALLAGELDVAVQPMNDRALHDAEMAITAAAHQEQSTHPQPIDAAVHSLKDLPGRLDERLVIAAVPEREDPRDALVSRHGLGLMELPAGAVVATSSLRRKAQVLHLRPDLRVTDIRGNVDTRLRKSLAPDGPDATILAVAGMKRLGLAEYITEYLPADMMVPAVGQGALAVEVRAGDTRLRRLLRAIDDPRTRRAVTAERAVLAELGGGCQVPLGAHATLSPDGQTVRLVAVVASLDGTQLVRVEREGPVARAAALGRSAARALLRGGAAEILSDILKRE